MFMKKKVILITSLCLLLLIIILSLVLSYNDELRFKLSYESINFYEYNNGKIIEVSIPWDNDVIYLNEKETLDFLNNETGILYFGYNTCPWCRNVVSVLVETAQENNQKIYYVDSNKLDLKSINDELFTILDDYLMSDEEGNKVLALPDVYFVKEGKIIGHHIGTVDGYNNPYKKMTDSQKQELKNIYQQLIEEMR